MKRLAIKLRTTVCVAGLLIPATSFASGFDNLGIGSMDMLFDPAKASIEFGYVYIDKNVEYKGENPQFRAIENDEDPEDWNDFNHEGPSKALATPNAWNYSVNAKIGVTDNVDCLGQLNNPGTIEEYLPEDWLGKSSFVFTDLQSIGLSATCSYKIQVIPGGYFRLIGGARYVEAQVKSGKNAGGNLAKASVSDSGFGWRAGAAFEYPEYAIRASLFYDSAIDLDLKGILDSPFGSYAATGSVTMPQGFEFRVQSGVAPKWLVFAGVKWVDWSVLKELQISADIDLLPGAGISTVRRFNFDDGWTVTAGVGHQLTESIQIGSSVTWDQGIGTSYSDTYSLGLGGAWQITDKIKWSLGGVVAYKTGAEDRYNDGSTIINIPPGTVDSQDRLDLSYDASWNFGIGTKLKFDF